MKVMNVKQLLVRYDKVGKKRYVRTITADGKALPISDNFGIIEGSKNLLERDYQRILRKLEGKAR